MIKFNSGGTVGDAYIILCKIISSAAGGVLLSHFTKHPSCHNSIREIYNLIPNIKVNFTKSFKFPVLSGNFNQNEGYEYDFEPYPKFQLPIVDNLPKKYCVVQLSSGRPGKPRLLPDRIIKKAFQTSLPIVLLGTDSTLIENAIDFRNKTSIAEAVSIINKANEFTGYQGFLSWVALSQKISSNIYAQSKSDKHAIKVRCQYWTNYLKEI